MKNKIFGSIAILAIAAIAAFNMNINTNENGLSEVSLANVEALASETLPSGFAKRDCSPIISGSIGGGNVTVVFDCRCSGSGSQVC